MATMGRGQDAIVVRCSRCGEPPAESEDWPDGDGGVLCQECWEWHCSETWWEMLWTVAHSPDAGLFGVTP